MRLFFRIVRAAHYAACAVAIAAAGVAATASVAQDAAPNLQLKPEGEHVYMQARCFACHGGYGFGGAGPRFREDRFVALKDYVVGQILIGRGIMPSFANALSDQQIAAVATYIRTSWGNNFGPVSADEVKHLRQEVKLNPPAGPHLPPPSTK